MRLFLALLLSVSLWGADYDWLFRNARVVDGAGNPWFVADVGVSGGKIAAIGNLADSGADNVVDARQRVLAPGFIDAHTHVEDTLAKVPFGDNFVFDGVTTVVTGNCGSSRVDLAEWLAGIEEAGVGLNVASLIGHSSVRAYAMGSEDRAPTAEELHKMEEVVEAAMRAGAVGLSTGLTYVPGAYAGTDEIVALAKVVARHDGAYTTHMRDEGELIVDAIEETLAVGREAGVRVEISHFKIDSKSGWGGSEKTIAMVEAARAEGIDVVVDQYPYDRSSTGITMLIPAWALAGGTAEFQERLQDAKVRASIEAGMREYLERKGHADYSWAMVAAFEPDTTVEGKTIPEINQIRGRPPGLDNEILTVLELAARGYVQMVYHSMSEEDVERIMRYPNTAVASDGGTREFAKGRPHPRSYGTNARVLARYVRELGVLTLEDAVRRMTSLPARTFGFRDRGLIREGMAADLVVFDPDKVEDRAIFDDPHQYSTGFDVVLVNGEAVVADGELTRQRPGQVLRHSP